MNQAETTVDTTVNTATVTEVTATAPVTAPVVAATPAVVVPKAPSKKSQADVIFAVKLIERQEGLFASNKEFRAAVLKQIQDDLGVSVASAATMYNSAKKAAETADATVALGRDPKKEKPAKVEGAKRGRPTGSKNKDKEVDPNAVVVAPVVADAAPATTEVVVNEPAAEAEAAPVVAEAAPAAEAAVA